MVRADAYFVDDRDYIKSEAKDRANTMFEYFNGIGLEAKLAHKD